jgi:N-acetylneuraminic acid mutarotase
MYVPKQDRWMILNPMPTERSGSAAASIDNNIFVIGGEKFSGSFNVNEKYDSITDTWSLEPPMPTHRLGHDAIELGNKIYVVGGKTSQPKDTVTGVTEIFVVTKDYKTK